MLTHPSLNQLHNRLAWALGKLATPALDDDALLMVRGHEMRIMLEWLTDDGMSEEFSYLASSKLLSLGFIEKIGTPGRHMGYRLTDEGKRFVGLRPTMPYEACAGWIALVKGECSPTHIHLTDSAHLQLMVYMLTAGWELPSRRVAGDTDELPAVQS